MNLEEIEVHVEMKKKFNNYPTVPEAAYSEAEEWPQRLCNQRF